MLRLLKYRIPAYIIMLPSMLMATFFYFYYNDSFGRNYSPQEVLAPSTSSACFTVTRLSGYNRVQPLMYVETESMSPTLQPLSEEITNYIISQQQQGNLISASFYLEDFSGRQWTGYNNEMKYNPGSLMKVPELIGLLRYEEENPGTLDKKVHYNTPFTIEKNSFFASSHQLETHKTYSNKELLKYMISYSDNNATILLDEQLDQQYFIKTLTDNKLPLPAEGARNYPVSAKDYSCFLRIIYNGSYLTFKNSEYAANLLATCDFNQGFARAFPPGIKMIHKFGEAGNLQERQLHESAIIYLNDKHYLLTVMSKGTDANKLAAILEGIATIVYKQIAM